MKRRSTAIGLALVFGISSAAGIVPAELPWSAKTAAAAADWLKTSGDISVKSPSLEVFRTTVQQRTTDLTAAIAVSRNVLLEMTLPRSPEATLESDLTKLMRLPTAQHQLNVAKEDLLIGTRNVEKNIAKSMFEYAAAARKIELWNERVRELRKTRDDASVQAKFGFVDAAGMEQAEEALQAANVELAAAIHSRDGLFLKVKESLDPVPSVNYSTDDFIRDYRIDSVSPDLLTKAALETDAAFRKLLGARGLEERRLAVVLELYRSFFGPEPLRLIESALKQRPIDYKLTLSLYNVFLAELKKQDAAIPAALETLRKEPYLGDQPYMLPAAVLSLASAIAHETDHYKAVVEQVNAYRNMAIQLEAHYRKARDAEAAAQALLQLTETRAKAGLADAAELAAARQSYAGARLAALEASGAYFHSVLDLHHATGGAFQGRLEGNAAAPVAAPPGMETSVEAAAVPLVTYEESLQESLALAAQKLQEQIAAGAADEQGADSEEAGGDTDGTDGEGVADTEGEEAAPLLTEEMALIFTEYDQLTKAFELAKEAQLPAIASALEAKLSASAADVHEALGISSPEVNGAAPTPEEQLQQFEALMPYLESGLFPAMEEQALSGFAEAAAASYDEQALESLKEMEQQSFAVPGGGAVSPLPVTAVAFPGFPVTLTVPPVYSEKTGLVYVPVRPFAEALQYRVVWIDSESVARLVKDGTTISIMVNTADVAEADGITVLDAATYMQNGQTMVPLSFFKDIMGFHVYWSGTLRQGVIFTSSGTEQSGGNQ